MKPVTYHLTESQIERLRSESKRTGLPVADLIRRAVDARFPPESEPGEFQHRGHVGKFRIGVDPNRSPAVPVVRGECKTDRGGLHFEAESVEQARDLFEWMVDRYLKLFE